MMDERSQTSHPKFIFSNNHAFPFLVSLLREIKKLVADYLHINSTTMFLKSQNRQTHLLLCMLPMTVVWTVSPPRIPVPMIWRRRAFLDPLLHGAQLRLFLFVVLRSVMRRHHQMVMTVVGIRLLHVVVLRAPLAWCRPGASRMLDDRIVNLRGHVNRIDRALLL